MEYKIDAANKILGRLATEVAVLLRGKERAAFDRSRFTPNTVTVYNTDKIRVSGKKMAQKVYRRHSGYHGGLKAEKLKDVFSRDSRISLRRAVLGMLPKNRLRSRVIKHLVMIKGENV